MSINVQCRCGKQYVLDDSKAGMTLRCKECGAPIVVPGDEGGFDDELDEMDEEDFSRRSPSGSRRGRQPSAGGGNTVLYWVLGIVGGIFLMVVITCGGCMFMAHRAANELIDQAKKEMEKPEFKKAMDDVKKQVEEEQKKEEDARQKAIRDAAEKGAKPGTPDPNAAPKTEPGQPSPTNSEKSGSTPPIIPNDPAKTEPAEPAEKK